MRKINLLLKVAVIFLLFSETTYGSVSELRKECRPLVDTFFQMTVKEMMEKLGSYGLEDQYRIFICGNQVMHPPAIYLAGPLAKQGAPAVALLRTKLASANDDLTIRDIVLVLTEIQRRRTYDVAGDEALVALVSDSIEKMRDEDWKRIAQENLSEIRQSHQ